MTTTLGALIASGNFTGYASSTAWFLDAYDIERLLHHRSYESYVLAEEHFDNFVDNEDFTAVEIHTWTCTDTLVGLHLICLNGTAVALSWQTARKSSRELALLSAEAREFLVKRWEAHRPEASRKSDFVDPATLGLPVAAPGQESFEVDEDAPIERLRPSLRGVAQWLTAIRDEGGLEAVTNRDTLALCRAGVLADVAIYRGILEHFEKSTTEQRERGGSELPDEEAEYRDHIAGVEAEILAPIEQRLAELDTQ